MSNIASPFGLKPAYSPTGCIRQQQGTIASGLTQDIFQFEPVQLLTTGYLQGAAAGSRAIGVFMGVEWTSSDGRRHYSNKWTNATVGTDIIAYYTSDPTIVYQVQANATLTLAAIGDQYDWSAIGGSAVTGLSSQSLDVASAAGAAASAGLRVIGLNPGPDNEFGDNFPILLVQFSEHQFVADIVAI